MKVLIGPLAAFAAFAVAFALHVAGGATDQGWLFAIAVVLIFALAAGFPIVAVLIRPPRGARERRAALLTGGLGGAVLMAGTLWAANGREWAAWTAPLAVFVAAIATAAAGKLGDDA